MGVLAKIPQSKLDFLLKIPFIGCLVAKKIRKELGLNSTFIWGSGAAPISVATLRWYSRLGINISEGWGMTENNARSEEHTSELQSRPHLVCRLLLEKKKVE